MDEIELRSKNVRRIIGPIPKTLFIAGVIMMLLIVISLVLALMYLPDPTGEYENLFYFVINSLKL